VLLPYELSQLYYDYTISAGALVLSPLEKRGGEWFLLGVFLEKEGVPWCSLGCVCSYFFSPPGMFLEKNGKKRTWSSRKKNKQISN